MRSARRCRRGHRRSVRRGETVVTDIHFIERGYENFVGKLRSIGADIVLERDDAEQCVAAAE